ncbi:MAG: hypothetical protein QN203_12580 [Armatimonadota bacterium]|nr:hypothetical protein [Armatimonadota bacterium]
MNPRSAAGSTGLHIVALVLLGVGLAALVARAPLPVVLGGVLVFVFVMAFLQRPDLGLLLTLVARTATDIGYVLLGDAPASEPLRLAALPNAVLISVLVLAGGMFILRRQVPLIRLPGGVLMALLLVTGLMGVLRSGRLLSGLAEWLPIVGVFVAYGLAASQFQTRRRIKHVIVVFAASLVIPALVGFWQWSGGTYFAVPELGVPRVSATFAHPNAFGIYLVTMLSVFLGQAFGRGGWRRLLAWSYVVTCAVLIGMTFARVAWVGALVVVATVGILRSPVLLLAIPAVAVMAGRVPEISARLADPLGGSFADRLVLWQVMLERWAEVTGAEQSALLVTLNRLVGLGPGAVGALTAPVRGIPFGAHNDYLLLLVEYGIFGLALYVVLTAVLIRLAYRAWRASRDAMLQAVALGCLGIALAFPVMGLTDHVVGQTVNQLYFWTLVGVTVRIMRMAPGGDGGPDSPATVPRA